MTIEKIPFGDAEAFNVVIEASQGAQKKYAYDSEMEAIKLSRMLYDGVTLPFNYGFVAQTESGDGRHLDAFVLATYPLARGTVATCRAIGILKMTDSGKRDNKIIAVPLSDSRMENLQDIFDWPDGERQKVLDFYKEAGKQWNKEMDLQGFGDRSEAKRELLRTLEFSK